MGSSIDSCTKGIWAWCRPHPKKQNEVLLLLDTEGLGDATKVIYTKCLVKRSIINENI
jgi:hypothetical protein